MIFRERWPLTAWGYPLTDLRSQGEPELQSFTGADVLLVMHVRGVESFGSGDLFGMRVRDDGTMTAALAAGAIEIVCPANYDDTQMEL